MQEFDLIVIGGGAAGFFGAISCAEKMETKPKILILEATNRVLTKVKVSGGGRCNVTHNQFEAKTLVQNYPRGQKELLGPFHKFQPRDTVNWFSAHGVTLKAEDDGRMFPITNNSQTIVDCLENTANKLAITLKKNSLVTDLKKNAEDIFSITTKSGERFFSKNVLLATGSAPFGVKLAELLGHKLISPVPSLFTFEISNPLIQDLSGTSFQSIQLDLKVDDKVFQQKGPCLITHWGLSGPAVLKLSAFAARELFATNYKAELIVNWEQGISLEKAVLHIDKIKKIHPKKKISNENPFSFSKRFWDSLLFYLKIDENLLYADLNKKSINNIAKAVTGTKLIVNGKGVFKEEFVTAGGVCREEIDFRTLESKLVKGLYFAGEVIDIDGITGGFNFQNAWTGSWLAGNDIAKKLQE
nr:NAD(P)/FAD-dependent oxidoreductase [Pigmentibacter ruber]